MSLTVAQIAAKALNAAQGAITDAVHVAYVSRADKASYDVATGAYANTPETQTGRAVVQNAAPSTDQFPGYVAGPNDQVLMLEGFTSVKQNDVVTIGARDLTVMAVQDIAGAGTVYMVAAR